MHVNDLEHRVSRNAAVGIEALSVQFAVFAADLEAANGSHSDFCYCFALGSVFDDIAQAVVSIS